MSAALRLASERMPSGPDRPAFLICVGRSGSTLLHEVLCRHPSAAWLTRYDERFPGWWLPTRALLRVQDVPMVSSRVATPRNGPREGWPFWEHHSPGFSIPGRDLLADDATPERAARLRIATRRRTTRRRSRLILKITGWPRIRFLASVFPDARFVHLVRDGRAVAQSQIERPWWTGADGPDRWAWGPLPPHYQQQWEQSRRSQAQLGAIAWQMALDALEDCKRELDQSRLLEVRYEDFCAEPRTRTQEILDFFGLGWVAPVESELQARSIENRNETRNGLIGSVEWGELGPVFQEHLARYGYS